MEVVAPGVGILTTYHNDYTNKLSSGFVGTSAATPFVTALAALLFSAHPDWTNRQVRDAIDQSTIHMGAAGRNSDYGFGRIDYLIPFIIDGDTNVDGRVDDSDVVQITSNFGKVSGQPAYNAAIDTNRDAVIDELDLFAIGRSFGKTQP
jgi:subtilisin family serine protease